ncbi:MarR family winged helix-turn-helix transcriptional regulator [Halalkalibacter sp. APA_J-10(15)]|uniref:MarR family winged helix-turn-helix transcriptional regulator n=1 Tax=unclassified Halalkalibacter TaxID=2893063 RepID=UPI001FF4E34B|nr:MarR family winged helix-turn-helix transcriptional regulator [Halalkalibacter sp. APA_J-10(15)]MCK0472390.1 MarR family winged helix-turn-helix transcriptional regulator [Halalkalibacter sp. APA_J-10(15)]
MNTYRLEDALGFLVSMAGRSLSNSVQRTFTENGFDATTEHWTVLVQLWNRDGLTQLELAERTGRDQASMSRLIRNMLNRQLIDRKKDPRDGRCKRIYLTTKGKEQQVNLMNLVQRTLEEATAGIPEEDVVTTKRVLKEISFRNTATNKVFQELDGKKGVNE